MSAIVAAAAESTAASVPSAPAPPAPSPRPGSTAAPFVCSKCGARQPAWLPQCPGCGAWNTMDDERDRRRGVAAAAPIRLSDVPSNKTMRLPTGIGELDRVLGGGLVPGGVTLLRGEPGAGKSTLLLQAAASAAASVRRPVLYGAAEEAPAQIAARGRRLGLPGTGVLLSGTQDVRALLAVALRVRPALLVVDSIHAFADPDLPAAPGAPSQVAAVCDQVVGFARATGTPVVAVVHVNADFAVRGGFDLVHQVDASLALERGPLLRVLRANKNRFGDVDEVGLFTMGAAGLAEVPNAAALWADGRPGGAPGASVAAVLEGSRVLLAEVQALVGPAKFSSPRVSANGYPQDRLDHVLAVLERRVRLPRLADSDCFVSVAGGLRLKDPAADLAVALAVASALAEQPLPEGIAAAGEVDLSGRVRRVPRLDDRSREAGRNGMRLWSATDAGEMGEALAALGLQPAAAAGVVSRRPEPERLA